MAYIDKDKVLEICEEHYQHCLEMHDWSGDTTADNIKEDIEKLPTADVQEVKHGEWIDKFNGRFVNPTYICSICGEKALYEFYKNELDQWKDRQALSIRCPYCGAKMDGGKAE